MNIDITNLDNFDTIFNEMMIEVLGAMENTLPAYLTYHSVEHTRGVLNDAIHIANMEVVSEIDLKKIKIAALFHDTGFMFTYKDHEEASCDYAHKILPGYQISDEDIIHINEMIMATKIPQTPKDHCGKILADADLAYLGTGSFEKISSLLFSELKHFNPLLNVASWNEIQIKFLKQHQYFTAYCVTEKSAIKDAHLLRLIKG